MWASVLTKATAFWSECSMVGFRLMVYSCGSVSGSSCSSFYYLWQPDEFQVNIIRKKRRCDTYRLTWRWRASSSILAQQRSRLVRVSRHQWWHCHRHCRSSKPLLSISSFNSSASSNSTCSRLIPFRVSSTYNMYSSAVSVYYEEVYSPQRQYKHTRRVKIYTKVEPKIKYSYKNTVEYTNNTLTSSNVTIKLIKTVSLISSTETPVVMSNLLYNAINSLDLQKLS